MGFFFYNYSQFIDNSDYFSSLGQQFGTQIDNLFMVGLSKTNKQTQVYLLWIIDTSPALYDLILFR